MAPGTNPRAAGKTKSNRSADDPHGRRSGRSFSRIHGTSPAFSTRHSASCGCPVSPPKESTHRVDNPDAARLPSSPAFPEILRRDGRLPGPSDPEDADLIADHREEGT